MFTKLKQTCIKTLVFCHFNLKYYIRIEIDTLGYAIDGVFYQLALDNLGQYHLIVFFFQKMVLVKTRYETYNNKFRAIIKPFKI